MHDFLRVLICTGNDSGFSALDWQKLRKLNGDSSRANYTTRSDKI
jgi:hypothetical protein